MCAQRSGATLNRVLPPWAVARASQIGCALARGCMSCEPCAHKLRGGWLAQTDLSGITSAAVTWDGAVRCVQLGSQGRCMLTGGWRACEMQAGPLTSNEVMPVVVHESCRGAGVEALEAIVSVLSRAVVAPTVTVRGLGRLG